MSTIRRNWTYDRVEDADVHEFLESLPKRQVSKYIRIALRMLMDNMDEEGNIKTPSKSKKVTFRTDQQANKQTSKKEDDSSFVDIDEDFLNLGK